MNNKQNCKKVSCPSCKWRTAHGETTVGDLATRTSGGGRGGGELRFGEHTAEERTEGTIVVQIYLCNSC